MNNSHLYYSKEIYQFGLEVILNEYLAFKEQWTFYLEHINDEIEEALDLRGVRVQHHQVSGAGLLQHGADQLAGDGDPVAVLLVSLAVEEERRDHDDVVGRGESEKESLSIMKMPEMKVWTSQAS